MFRLLFIFFNPKEDIDKIKKGPFYSTKETPSIIYFNKRYNFKFIKESNSGYFFLKNENKNFIKEFYSKKLDIGLILGENGTGKSILINSLREKNKDNYTIIFEVDNKIKYYGSKKIIIDDSEIDYADLPKSIYYTSIIENKSFDGELDISNRYLLQKQERSLEKSLSLLENDDICLYFKNSELFKKEKKPDSLKLHYTDNFINQLQNKLDNVREEINNSLFEINVNKKDFKDEFYKYFILNGKISDSSLNEVLSNNEIVNGTFENVIKDIDKRYGTRLNSYVNNFFELYDSEYEITNNKLHVLSNDIILAYNEKNGIDEIIENLELEIREFHAEIWNEEEDLETEYEYNNLSQEYIIDFLIKFFNLLELNYEEKSFLKGYLLNILNKDKVLKKSFFPKKISDLDIYINIIVKSSEEKTSFFKKILGENYIITLIPDYNELLTLLDIKVIKLLFVYKFIPKIKELIGTDKIKFLLILTYIYVKENYKLDDFKEIDFKKDYDLSELYTIFNIDLNFDDISEDCNQIINDKNRDKFFNLYKTFIENNLTPFHYELFPPFSSGEKARMIFYARLNNCLDKLTENDKEVLILLDEADLKLHLEWQRTFLSNLIEFLTHNSEKKFFILLATHSPMVLSDLTNDRIVFLVKDDNGQSVDKQLINTNNIIIKDTFGANIYDIYNNSFFMNSFMGEFAEEKINSTIILINLYEVLENSDKKEENLLKLFERYHNYNILNVFDNYFVESKEIKSYSKNNSKYLKKIILKKEDDIKKIIFDNKDEIKKVILTIGEPLLRNTVLEKFTKIFNSDSYIKNILSELLSEKDMQKVLERINQETRSIQNEIMQKYIIYSNKRN